jgi:hypothetical protein
MDGKSATKEYFPNLLQLMKQKKKSALWEGRLWEFFLLAKKNVQAHA